MHDRLAGAQVAVDEERLGARGGLPAPAPRPRQGASSSTSAAALTVRPPETTGGRCGPTSGAAGILHRHHPDVAARERAEQVAVLLEIDVEPGHLQG